MEQNSRPYLKSLRGKLATQTLLIGLVPVLAVGALAYVRLATLTADVAATLESSRRQLAEDVVGANLDNTAAQIAGQIDLFMHERIADALVWSKAPVVIDSARRAKELHRLAGLEGLAIEAIEAKFTERKSLGEFAAADAYLTQQIALSPQFGEAFFTDSNGYNVALTNATSDFVQSDEGWWQTAWAQGISIGEVEYDNSAGIWSVDISVRIDDPSGGDRVGVMKTVLGVSLIQNVTDLAAAKIRDGQVAVATTAGLLLADTYNEHARRRIMNEKVNLRTSGSVPVKNAFAASAASGFDMDDATVVGFAKSAGAEYFADVAKNFKGFGWVTLVEQSRDTAFAPIAGLGVVQRELEESRNTLALTLLAAVVVVAILSVAVANLLSRSITVPILELRDVADRVSRGDTSQPVIVTADDEVGDLARDFERMRKSLEVAMRRLRSTA